MPPQSSLPLRDGRVGLPPPSASSFGSQTHDADYSDDDIRLVEEIVRLAESLYPALPEEIRLPTNALFKAAEQVLPSHGYDGDNPPNNISRLIFKIGGQRSGETLGDKFQAVLASMNIHLEYIPSSPYGDSPAARSRRPPPKPAAAVSNLDSSSYDLPALPRARARAVSPTESFEDPRDDRAGLRESPLIIPNAHLIRRSPHSEGSDGFRGTSDTTAQSRDEQDVPSPAYQQPVDDIDLLEANLRQLKMQDDPNLLNEAFFVWHCIATHTRSDNRELESLAAEFDDNDMLVEVLDIWREFSILAQTRRLESKAAAEHAEYVERMERRAGRVYEIFTIRTVLAQWQDGAREEADRTAVARRHLVRKRAFDGWLAQHVADESKVTNFILIHALQRWGQVSLHHEVRKGVAIRHYEHALPADCLDVMRRVFKTNLADRLRDVRIVYDCINTWYSCAREAELANALAIEVDERLLLDEAVVIWREEADYLESEAHSATIDFLTKDCQRKLQHWQEQARLERLLRQYMTANRGTLRHRVLETWHSAFLTARYNGEVADILTIEGPLEIWLNQAKLRIFEDDLEFETKQAVLKHWYLEERLAWYQRYTETRSKREALGHFLAAAHQQRGARISAEQEAEYVQQYHTIADCLEGWLGHVDGMRRLLHNANLIRLYRAATPCLDTWREHYQQSIVRSAYYRRQADSNAAGFVLSNVLDTWPAVAEQARRERLMNSLRQYRRAYKIDLAQATLEQWLLETSSNLDRSRVASNFHIQQRREDIDGYIQLWLETTKTAQTIWQYAAEAELEAYRSIWKREFDDAQDLEVMAINHDAMHTLKDCWRRWEFQGLQIDSQQRMVAALQNRNEKRLCRQIFEDWLLVAAPDSTHFDLLQFSTMSRRPARYPNPSTRQVSTPYLPVSQLGFGRGGSSMRLGTTPRDLGPMTEFDDDESLLPGAESNDPGFMSTPTRWTGSARPLGYRPTTTPSAILPSPYERELRQEYGQTRPRVEFADIQEESLED
ncbi:Sfi1 spindle body protein-domain-containing protein [Echria macrotheca]|uniref:Sfi1 spindle body protein-domain-containing protein n=1 Tax=Echria macrotheca TaxID=438768 RepID=A0AAJ0FAK7_9PEZI|nr:Sfi1 spindle body protein-domain-containing protein [Echria macrotheca]